MTAYLLRSDHTLSRFGYHDPVPHVPLALREEPAAYEPDLCGVPFSLGRILATPGALAMARAHGLDLAALVARHRTGDWGDLCAEDRAANERALRTGARLLSRYDTPGGTLWVITEADRSATTILRPDEY
jgi:hypothetical protein